MRVQNLLMAALTAALVALPISGAKAQDAIEGLESIGVPHDKGIAFQPAATSLAEGIHNLDTMLLVIITAIVVFVLAIILIIIARFNRASNSEPARFTHNSPLEVAWTVVPIIILVFIGAFSLPVLWNQQVMPKGDVTIKVTGYQWYWTYEYPESEFSFPSYMIGQPATLNENDRPADADVTPYVLDDAMRAKLVDAGYNEDEFLLATDTAMVVPTGKKILLQITGADVIHAWTIPSFGVKQDAVPGRLAEAWFEVDEGMEGIYFGQCSELCGKDHAYMPITVMAVTQDEYDAWLEGAIAEYAGTPLNLEVAAAE